VIIKKEECARPYGRVRVLLASLKISRIRILRMEMHLFFLLFYKGLPSFLPLLSLKKLSIFLSFFLERM
jgi:hypothetical protein